VKMNGKKINYHDFITACSYEECNNALLRIVPRIDIDGICSFIDSIGELSELQKLFYKKYIANRYKKILLVAYEKLNTHS